MVVQKVQLLQSFSLSNLLQMPEQVVIIVVWHLPLMQFQVLEQVPGLKLQDPEQRHFHQMQILHQLKQLYHHTELIHLPGQK